jgi:Flp pilus assembly protein CpaB
MDPRRRARIILILGILLALGAGAGTFFYASSAQTAAPVVVPTTDVVVAAKELPPRTQLTAADVKIAKVNVDAAPATALKDPKEAVGKIITSGVTINEPLFPSKFAPPEKAFTIFPPGESVAPGSPHYRIVQLNVADAQASGGIIQTGDHVDLMVVFQFDPTAKLQVGSPPPGGGTPRPSPPPTPSPAGTPIPGATPNPTTSIPPQSAISADTIAKIFMGPIEVLNRTGTTYTFRVDAAMVERFTYMQGAGMQIHLLLRAPGDDRSVTTTGAYFGTVYNQFRFPLPERVSP